MAETDVILHRLGEIDKKLGKIEDTTDSIQKDVSEIRECNAGQAQQIERNKEDIGKLDARQWAFAGGNALLTALAAVFGLK